MFTFAISASGPLSDSGLNQGRRGIFVPNQKSKGTVLEPLPAPVGTKLGRRSFVAEGSPGIMRYLAIAVSAVLLGTGLPVHASAGQSFSGMAAYYSGRGSGFTAAHRTLPFGTRVRVTDPKTGRSVVVTINDRGPFGHGRILDLCTRAARALGMISRGVIFVRADVL